MAVQDDSTLDQSQSAIKKQSKKQRKKQALATKTNPNNTQHVENVSLDTVQLEKELEVLHRQDSSLALSRIASTNANLGKHLKEFFTSGAVIL